MSDLKVYGAPWCPDCRRSKQFLGEQRIPYDWVDIDTDPEAAALVRRMNDGKQIIPTIVFADGSFVVEPSNAELAQKLGLTLRAERTYYDLLIVGGGPAGLTAAIYAAREGIDVLVVERSGLGGQAGVTERVENYPGFPEGIGGGELADRIIAQARRYGVELLQAVGVSSLGRTDPYVVATTEQGDEYCARAAIVATGSTYRRLGVPGEDDLIGAGIHYCATCDGPFYRGADELVVIGGGNSAAEEALFLTQFAKTVRVLVRGDELRASALVRDKIREHPEIDVRTRTEIVELRMGPGGKLGGVVARDTSTGELVELTPAAAFVFIGLDPNTAFLRGAVELDEWGFIRTDNTLQASVPGIFAAGDVRAGSTKQIASAIGEGATALLMVRQYLERAGDVPAHEPG